MHYGMEQKWDKGQMREIWDISEKRIGEGRTTENEGIPDLGQKPRETQAFSVLSSQIAERRKERGKNKRRSGSRKQVCDLLLLKAEVSLNI